VVRTVFSIVCGVIAGFFVYMVSLLSFIDMPPATAKFLIIGGFAVPLVVFLLAAIALARFRKWKSTLGVVLLSGTGVNVLVVFTLAMLLLSPEFLELFPHHKLDFFSDYVTGGVWTLVLLGAGIALVRSDKAETAELDAAADLPQAATRG
jgi:hypothetical protein